MPIAMQKQSLLPDLWPLRCGASFLVPRSITGLGFVTVLASAILPRPISYIILYPSFRLLFGTLYPAYASYKAVRTKDVKEYVKWMMYWIVFALFTCAETFTDIFFSFWFPFYYELKIIMVIYLLSPATKGSSILYRKFVHPALIQREQEIDEYIARAKEQGYHTVLTLGTKGVNYATSILMQTAIKGGGGLVNQIRKSYSLADLPLEHQQRRKAESHDELDDTYPEGDVRLVRRKRGASPRRTVSSGSQVDLYFPEVDVRDGVSDNFIPSHIRSSEDVSSGYVSSDTAAIKQEAKERLVRTSSVSRVRTRASTKSEHPTTLSEELADSAEVLVDESQNLSDSVPLPIQNLESPSTGNVLSPFVRPHLQYLFSNLSETELFALVTSATAPVNPINSPKIDQRPSSSENLSNLISNNLEKSENAHRFSPSKTLSNLISNDIAKNENEQFGSAENFENQKEDKNCTSSLDSSVMPNNNIDVNITGTQPENELKTEILSDEKEEINRVVRRTKKRQAPIPPMGGSLIDLNRLSDMSQISDQMEVSSVLDFETDFVTPDSSPSRSNASLNEKKRKAKTLNDNKTFLQFPKMPFSFWQKPKPSGVSHDAHFEAPKKDPDVHDSFISLHEDLSTNLSLPSQFSVDRVRDMSQSPSSKRRSGVS